MSFGMILLIIICLPFILWLLLMAICGLMLITIFPFLLFFTKFELTITTKEEKMIKTTCDICGKVIVGVDNFINAGDMVVCSEECKQKAIGKFFVENSLTSEERNGMLISYKDRLWAGKD